MHTSHATPSMDGRVDETDSLALWPPFEIHRPGTSDGEVDDADSRAAEVNGAQERARLEQEVEALRRRLATQPVIEQAKGVLMSHYGFGADAAFAALARWSQYTNTKLYLLAGDLVEAASDPSGKRGARLTGFLSRLPPPARRLLPSEGKG